MPAIDYRARPRAVCVWRKCWLYSTSSRGGSAAPRCVGRVLCTGAHADEPVVHGAPRQEPVALFWLRRQRQRPRSVGGRDAATAARGGV